MADDSDIQQVSGERAIAAMLQRHFEVRGVLTLLPDDNDALALKAPLVGHDAEQRQLLFDVTSDDRGDALLQAENIVVRGTMDGLPCWFFSADLSLREEGQDRYFVLPYPNEVFLLQRRDAFRVRLPATLAASAQVTPEGGVKRLTCRVLDVSVTGVGLVMSTADADRLSLGMTLTDMLLVLDGLENIVVTAVVRNMRPLVVPGEHLVGIEFLTLSQRQEQALQRFILQRQRERLLER